MTRTKHGRGALAIISSKPRREQGGSALIIGMILLLLMTLLSLMATMETRTDARITSNHLDRIMAFQVAEAALREAESLLNTTKPDELLAGEAGFYDELTNPPTDYDVWDSTNSFEYGEDIASIAERPRYVIDQLQRGSVLNGYLVVGEVYHGHEQYLYQITVTCTGRSGQTRVVIQSTFSPPEA